MILIGKEGWSRQFFYHSNVNTPLQLLFCQNVCWTVIDRDLRSLFGKWTSPYIVEKRFVNCETHSRIWQFTRTDVRHNFFSYIWHEKEGWRCGKYLGHSTLRLDKSWATCLHVILTCMIVILLYHDSHALFGTATHASSWSLACVFLYKIICM